LIDGADPAAVARPGTRVGDKPLGEDIYRLRIAVAWLGALLFACGFVVILGWCLGSSPLVQILPSLPPVQFNAAVGIGALGAGVLSLVFNAPRLALAMAALPTVIGFVTAVTWVFDLSPGIDELVVRHEIATLTPIPGRMPINNAFSLVLAGIALALASLHRRPGLVAAAWMLGAMTFVRGVLGAAWSLLDVLDVTPDFPGAAHMTIQFGLATALTGAAIFLLTWSARTATQASERIWEIPVLAAGATAMTSLLLWQALTVADDTRMRVATRDTLAAVAGSIESEAGLLGSLITRMARQAEWNADLVPLSHWEQDAEDQFRGNVWLRQIVRVDRNGSILSRVARDPAESLPRVSQGRDAAGDLSGSLNESATPTMWLPEEGIPPDGHTLAVLSMPIDSGAGGRLEFTIRLDEMLREAIGMLARGYGVVVMDGKRVVYSRLEPGAGSPRNPDFTESARLGAYGKELLLQVIPGRSGALGASTLPRLVLLFGLVLSLLVAVVMRYATVARWRSVGIIEAGELLKREVEERRRAELAARESEARAQRALADVQQVLNQSQDLICIVDHEGTFRVVSPSSWAILGYRPEEMTGRHWSEFVFRDDIDKTAPEVEAIRTGKVTREFENRYVHRNGHLVDLSWSSTWVAESRASYSIARDVTARNRQGVLREGQRQVLQLIAEGTPLQVVLDAICSYVELIDPESLCSVLLVDADGLHLRSSSAPSLPAEYVAAVDGIEIGPAIGCCGTAAWRNELVVVEDIETDPLWGSFRPLAARHGLRSCWSMPIKGEHGTVLGTFAIYHRQPERPELHELDIIEAAAGLASVAIERDAAQKRLVEGKEQLELARRIAQLGYWELYLDSGRVALSQDMQQRLGLPIGQEQAFADLLSFVVEADRTKLVAARDALASNVGPIDSEIRLQMPDGAVRHVLFRGRTIHRDDGSVVKMAGTVQDITSRKLIELENARLYAELEDRVKSRTRELEQSNRELEAFSYSVSHDLRAPLRAISGFGALLRDEHGAALDTRGRHYLDRIISGTVRMSALIDDLLELGRVSRITITRQAIDLTLLATQVSNRLRERWPERIVEVSIQPGLVASGDLRLMEVVMDNLLENAWKFTSSRSVGQIRIGRLDGHGEHVFFVADNGVGFDPQYAANLFGVFQRLHASGAFPGTGVGLATVQRILQRHGGRAWADARPDGGATFYFTLP